MQRALADSAPAGVRPESWARVRRLYQALAFGSESTPLLWIGADGHLTARGRTLVAALTTADQQGLRSSDYPLDTLREALAAAREQPSMTTRARADVLASAAFASYAADVLTGRLDPKEIDPAWHVDANTVNVDSALAATLAGPATSAPATSAELRAAFERLRPSAHGYDTLVAGLARYRQLAADGGWPTIPDGASLHVGDSTAAAPQLRRRLAVEGFFPTTATRNPSTRYDTALAAGVARFQAHNGLVVDSIVGPNTREALNASASDRVRHIEASLERLRWLPRHLGDRHILVNIPAFRLDAYDAGTRALSMSVVVGAEYDDRATPVFADTMKYVVINPYWNVPQSIASSELWPKQRRDPSYFRRNNYEVVHASWGTYVRQLPGPDNALGRIKFIFPNDFNVYLHDTPAQDLFGERVRAFSHGCVRVAKPLALAQFVLGPQGWDEARVRDSIATSHRQRVDLKTGVPVYIVYVTASPAPDGGVAFRRDLYDRDARLLSALAQDPQATEAGDAAAARLARFVGVAVSERGSGFPSGRDADRRLARDRGRASRHPGR